LIKVFSGSFTYHNELVLIGLKTKFTKKSLLFQ
jgi:hypothetical protein